MLLLFCLTDLILYAKQKSSQWSNYQGFMNWYNAKKKCVSIEMRLPSRSEIKIAYKSTLTGSWQKDWEESEISGYWILEESSKGYAYNFFVDNGVVFDVDKGESAHVRCIR